MTDGGGAWKVTEVVGGEGGVCVGSGWSVGGVVRLNGGHEGLVGLGFVVLLGWFGMRGVLVRGWVWDDLCCR